MPQRQLPAKLNTKQYLQQANDYQGEVLLPEVYANFSGDITFDTAATYSTNFAATEFARPSIFDQVRPDDIMELFIEAQDTTLSSSHAKPNAESMDITYNGQGGVYRNLHHGRKLNRPEKKIV